MQGARGGQGPWAVVTQQPWEAGQAWRRQGQWAGTRGVGWPVGEVSEGDSVALCGWADPQVPPRVTRHCPVSWPTGGQVWGTESQLESSSGAPLLVSSGGG